MQLTEEQKVQGRRTFLKAVAGAPALAALGAAALTRGPISGGPVRMAMVGTGDFGRMMLGQYQREFVELRALCDINPGRRAAASEALVRAGWPRPNEYDDWREMLDREPIEAVHVATPLWAHADISVGCLEAGKHVLCEKMMAKSEADCRRMIQAAERGGRLLEIGYQRFYNPIYQAAYEHIIRRGLLGEVYYARLVWHRNSTWRKQEEPPAPDFDPSRWGYPDWEHLLNWRMYRRYSEGLLGELGSHQLAAASWFFDSAPEAVYTTGGTFRFKDGREVFDHVFATFNYTGGRTATFTSIQSNALEGAYEMYMGTRGTLILRSETEAYLFDEGEAPATRVEVSPRSSDPVLDTSASRPAQTAARTIDPAGGARQDEKSLAYKNEIAEFCSAVRTGSALRCGAERALRSAVSVLTANRAAEQMARLEIAEGNSA